MPEKLLADPTVRRFFPDGRNRLEASLLDEYLRTKDNDNPDLELQKLAVVILAARINPGLTLAVLKNMLGLERFRRKALSKLEQLAQYQTATSFQEVLEILQGENLDWVTLSSSFTQNSSVATDDILDEEVEPDLALPAV